MQQMSKYVFQYTVLRVSTSGNGRLVASLQHSSQHAEHSRATGPRQPRLAGRPTRVLQSSPPSHQLCKEAEEADQEGGLRYASLIHANSDTLHLFHTSHAALRVAAGHCGERKKVEQSGENQDKGGLIFSHSGGRNQNKVASPKI